VPQSLERERERPYYPLNRRVVGSVLTPWQREKSLSPEYVKRIMWNPSTLCGQNAELLRVKCGGAYSNNCALQC